MTRCPLRARVQRAVVNRLVAFVVCVCRSRRPVVGPW